MSTDAFVDLRGLLPIADGLFTWPSDRPQLIGCACSTCGVIMFPKQSGCPRCGAAAIVERLLATEGTLWSWTIQRFRPKSPPYAGGDDEDTFLAYGVGYVELPGEVKVETRLTVADPEALRIGMPMTLTIVPFVTDDRGTMLSYAFAPRETARGEQ